jgi:hypothetical protein
MLSGLWNEDYEYEAKSAKNSAAIFRYAAKSKERLSYSDPLLK